MELQFLWVTEEGLVFFHQALPLSMSDLWTLCRAHGHPWATSFLQLMAHTPVDLWDRNLREIPETSQVSEAKRVLALSSIEERQPAEGCRERGRLLQTSGWHGDLTQTFDFGS